MAYDGQLADRIRELLVGEPAVTEKRMFGGLAFLVGGNMAVAASGQGGILLRANPDDTDALVAKGAELAVMRGRAMKGSLRLEASALADQSELRSWVDLGVAYARSLPPK